LNGKTGKFDVNEGYVVASYAGYDDNRPMKGKHITIYGASGALPMWIKSSKAIANSQEYRKGIRAVDLTLDTQSRPLEKREEGQFVKISAVTGLPLAGHDANVTADSLEVQGDIERKRPTFVLKRAFEPLKGAMNDSTGP
jgi:membrane carboxypeptidase/penicillin-binding protein